MKINSLLDRIKRSYALILLLNMIFLHTAIIKLSNGCPPSLIADTSANWYEYSGNKFIDNFNGNQINKINGTDTVFRWNTDDWAPITFSQNNGMLHIDNWMKWANINLMFDSTTIDASQTPYLYMQIRASTPIASGDIEIRVSHSQKWYGGDSCNTGQWHPAIDTSWTELEYDLSEVWKVDITRIARINIPFSNDVNTCERLDIRYLALGDTSYKVNKVTNVTDVTCPGGSDGAIDIETENGDEPYTFTWTTSDGSGLSDFAEDQTGLTAGTYKVVVKDNNDCFDSTSFTINDGIPPVADAGPNESICSGDTTELKATGGCSYLWSTGDGTDTVIVSPGSNTTYTVTVTDTKGCTDTDNMTITVNSLPSASIIPDPASTCVNDTLNLDGNPSGGAGAWNTHSWTGDIGQLSATNVQTPKFSPQSSGNYNLTYTVRDNNGCTATDDINIDVENSPTADAGTGGSECDQDFVLNASPSIGTGTWTKTAGSGNADFSPNANSPDATVTVDVYGTYTFQWEENNNGCTDAATVNVNFYEQPVADAGDPDTICAGDNITLTADGGDNYEWINGPNDPMYDISPDITTVYMVIAYKTNGCSDTSSVEITVNPLPNTSEISGEANPPCNASGVTYSVTSHPGAHYEWSVPVNGTIISDTSGPGHNNITVNFGNKNGNITVLETSAEGCTGPQKSLPVYMVGCDLDPAFDANDTSICFGDTVTFTNWSSGVTDTSIFEWDFGDGAIPATETDTGLATTEYKVFYSTTGQKTVSLRVYEGKIDTLNRDDYITVNSLPDANAGANVSICQGDTVELTANGGESYEWKNQPDVQTISINPADSTLYFVTVTDVNGCQDDDSVYVYVNPLPTVTGNDIDNLHYNSDTFLTINTGTGDYSYQWSPANMLLPANDTLSNPATVNLTGDQTYTVTVTNNQTGCYSIENIHVTVTGVPLSIIAGTDTAVDANVSICFGDQILLTAFPSGGTGNYTVKWDTVPLYDASLLSKKTEISVSPSETMTYVVEADDGTEISKDSITVFVNPLPVTSVWPEDTTVVSHAIVPLHAEGGTDYLWQPKEYLVDADTLQHPRAQPVVSTLYIVRVTNQYGCHSYDTIIVDTMACKLWVPEAFTPNGDQVNDVFKAEGFGIDGFNMILFNRWGEQIFESNSIDDGWDGALNDNSQHTQSVGYIIKATCQDNKTIIEKKGNIYIVR